MQSHVIDIEEYPWQDFESLTCVDLRSLCGNAHIPYRELRKTDMCRALRLHIKDPTDTTHKFAFPCPRCSRRFKTKEHLEAHRPHQRVNSLRQV